MDATSISIIVGLFAVTQGLIEIMKILVNKRNGTKIGNPIDLKDLKQKVDSIYESTLGTPELNKLIHAIEIITAKDENGLPLVYYPRSLIRLTENQLKKLDTIIDLLKKQ